MDARVLQATTGERLRIWIKRARRGPMDAVGSAAVIAGRGIERNADHGGWRHITVIDEAAWHHMMADPRCRASRGRIAEGGPIRIGDVVTLT